MLSLNDEVYWLVMSKIRAISMILCTLELIFSVVLFDDFSCLERSLYNHSYQSSNLTSMVDEYSKILHYHHIRLKKMDRVIILGCLSPDFSRNRKYFCCKTSFCQFPTWLPQVCRKWWPSADLKKPCWKLAKACLTPKIFSFLEKSGLSSA